MKKRWKLIAAILALVVVLIEVLAAVVDEPLRRYMEREMNSRLKGYTLQINKLTLHPFGLSIDLENLFVYQKKHPQPPIANIRRIHGGIHRIELLTAHLVADAEIDNPKLYVNLKNLITEMAKPPAEKEAWQDTLEALYPFKVNEFRIKNGEVTYAEEEQSLVISEINIVAHTIRNVRSPETVYPSDFMAEAVLPGSGKIRVNGRGDFMLKPFAGVKADVDLEGTDLAGFKSFAERHNVALAKGMVSGAGSFEFAPKKKVFILRDLIVRNPEIDYIYLAAAPKKKPPPKIPKEPAPGMLIKAERIRIVQGNLGIVNKAANPGYRVSMEDLDLVIVNFSNKFSEGPANLHLKGKFMGSGDTSGSGTFRAEKQGPDFDIKIAIKNTNMRAMNNIFRAYGNFDVSAGLFSFYSELAVKNDKVTGYLKPLFRKMKVYDKRQDKEKSEFHKLYEELAGGVATLLENRPRKAVATKTPIKGTEEPKPDTWDTIINLFQNAFFRAILPGFEKSIK